MRREVRGLVFLVVAGLLVSLNPPPAPAGDDDRVRLQVEITAEETGEPIQNAAVYVKFKHKRLLWRDKKMEWSSKTNGEGKAVFPLLPGGRALIQVVAKGWKTYGRYHTLRGPKHRLEIKLKRPKKWY
ncbi:MAG: carboxypeptidase-like regulatory domain-containing protein [Terriglobia bacterium]